MPVRSYIQKFRHEFEYHVQAQVLRRGSCCTSASPGMRLRLFIDTMPTVTINQKPIAVPDGTTIIQAAEQLSIEIPRYCYHPGLSVAGSCRMCLVEIEKMPKLQPACNTRVTEGMVVTTNSPKVKEAVSGVLEFLLINHPLDCPVCDQAGECYLQEYYMKFGLYDSRMNENKIKRHKAEPIGPHVILDTERCVCARVVCALSAKSRKATRLAFSTAADSRNPVVARPSTGQQLFRQRGGYLSRWRLDRP